MNAVVGAIILLLLAAQAGLLADVPTFRFVQIADTQLGFTSGNTNLEPEISNFKLAVERINTIRPSFVLVSGDQLNEAHNTRQIRAFFDVLSEVDSSIPVYLTAGNHDMHASSAASIASYERFFGPDRYAFTAGNSRFLVVNSNLIKDPGVSPEARQEQYVWMESELKKASEQSFDHIVVCAHHPWFIGKADEPEQYFNIPPIEREKCLALMDRYGVTLALAGHTHRNYKAASGRLTMITSGAVSKSLGPETVGYAVYTVYKDRIDHRWVPLDQELSD